MATPLTSLQPLQAALSLRPFGLLCDVDGTLSPMAPTPLEASVTPRNLALLETLSKRIVVAVVSGRDLPDLRSMVELPRVAHVGLHGLAWSIDGNAELEPDAEAFRALTLEADAQLAGLRQMPGLTVEVKTIGLAFHFRQVVNPEAARDAILDAVATSTAASFFQVHEGILMLELRPPIGITKGIAVRRMAERFALRGLLFLGDDVTDIDGFHEARRLRESGEVDAYGIAVTHPEAPPAAAEAADFSVRDVSGVEWLLGEIVSKLEGEAQ